MAYIEDLLDDENSIKKNSNTSTLISLSYKNLIILFFIYIFVESDVFLNTVVCKFSNTTDGKDITTFGLMLKGFFLIMLYIFFTVAINKNFI